MGNCTMCASSDEVIKATVPDPVDTTFAGKYKVGAKLGAGSYGSVYVATNKVTQERYAAKIIDRAKLSPEGDKRIRSEVDVLGAVTHPHIIHLVDFYEDDKKYYIVTDLCEGGEVFRKIVEKKRYTEKEARDLIKILLEAVAYCHSLGIVHRDLKPENLLLTSSSDVSSIKIADFGYATRMAQGGLVERLGTPAYVAPEILRGKTYDQSVDCWSIGVITFLLLGGYPPFTGRTQTALFRKIKRSEYHFHSSRWEAVSEEARDLISRLLHVDPSRRISAREALGHAWITAGDARLSRNQLTRAASGLRVFNAQRRFRAAANAIIVAKRFGKMALTSPTSSPNASQESREEEMKVIQEAEEE